MGSTDAGLLTIEGKLVKGVTTKEAEAALNDVILQIAAAWCYRERTGEGKNKTESMMAFEDMSVMNRATSIAMYELLGDANLINTELQRYQGSNG